MNNLLYTIAFDEPGCGGYRSMAKICVSSLLRTFFSGDIVVFRNTAAPLFLVERKGLEEIFVKTPDIQGPVAREYTQRWKFQARRYIDAAAYEKIIYLDCDSIALRDVDGLFEGEDWEIRHAADAGKTVSEVNEAGGAWFHEEEVAAFPGRPSSNPWLFAINGPCFDPVMEEWERWDAQVPVGATVRRDIAVWNRLLANVDEFPHWCSPGAPGGTGSERAAILPRCQAFPGAEVLELASPGLNYQTYSQAALLHCGGGPDGPFDVEERIRFLFGMWMRTFHCDATAQLLHMLEN
ncbi:MAG TPA: hypothetical protein VMN36_02405 [Verrucomicrobiales bacterium]|nr:hypothetical protein [Verrucomicrobiales bacterium]